MSVFAAFICESMGGNECFHSLHMWKYERQWTFSQSSHVKVWEAMSVFAAFICESMGGKECFRSLHLHQANLGFSTKNVNCLVHILKPTQNNHWKYKLFFPTIFFFFLRTMGRHESAREKHRTSIVFILLYFFGSVKTGRLSSILLLRANIFRLSDESCTCVCVSGGKKCPYFGKYGVLYFLLTLAFEIGPFVSLLTISSNRFQHLESKTVRLNLFIYSGTRAFRQTYCEN